MRVTRFSALWLIFSLISANFLLPWSAGLQPAAAQTSTTGSGTGTRSGAATTGGVTEDDINDEFADFASVLSTEALEYRKTYDEYIKDGSLTKPSVPAASSGEACVNGIADGSQQSASAAIFDISSVRFSSAPPFQHGCFFLSPDKANLYHSFKYGHSTDAVKTNQYYLAEFTEKDDIPVYGGCLRTSATCNKDDATTYDFFSKQRGDITDLITTTTGDTSITTAGSIGTTYKPINTWSFNMEDSYRPSADPTSYRLLTDPTDVVVYRIIDLSKSGDELSYAIEPPDFLRSDFSPHGARHVSGGVDTYLKDYISRVNGLKAAERRFGKVNITGNVAESTYESLRNGSRFGILVGNNKERLAASEGFADTDSKLTNAHQDFLLVEGEASDNPKKPPQLVISGPRLGINSATNRNDLIFDLVAVVKSETWAALRANNYFLFKLSDSTKLNKDQTDFFKNEGVDPDVMYIAIDLMGNIGFLVDDKSKAGGIFGTNKDRFDRSADDNLIAIGQFSANASGISNNNNGGPLQINLQEYRWLITKRTYNDPPESTIGCDTQSTTVLVHYGQENTVFDSISPSIPHNSQLNCLATHKAADEDDAKSSWIAVWNLKVHKLDQFKNDECTNAFFKGGGFFGNVMGSFFCGLIGTMTGWAASAAGFSIDLVIDALGLQSS